jgi:hypothetical protein
MTRLVLRPFTFSNGVTVPAGTIVSVPASSTHTDERIYSNPNDFDGFRFAKLRKIEGHTAAGSKYQSVSTSNEYLAFGLGRHQWLVFCQLFMMISDPTHRYLPSVPDDSLRSMKSRDSWPILSRRMISSSRKGKVFRAGITSLECVPLRLRMRCSGHDRSEVTLDFTRNLFLCSAMNSVSVFLSVCSIVLLDCLNMAMKL